MGSVLPFLPMNGTYTLVQGLYIPLASVTFLRLGYLLYERRSPCCAGLSRWSTMSSSSTSPMRS